MSRHVQWTAIYTAQYIPKLTVQDFYQISVYLSGGLTLVPISAPFGAALSFDKPRYARVGDFTVPFRLLCQPVGILTATPDKINAVGLGHIRGQITQAKPARPCQTLPSSNISAVKSDSAHVRRRSHALSRR